MSFDRATMQGVWDSHHCRKKNNIGDSWQVRFYQGRWIEARRSKKGETDLNNRGDLLSSERGAAHGRGSRPGGRWRRAAVPPMRWLPPGPWSRCLWWKTGPVRRRDENCMFYWLVRCKNRYCHTVPRVDNLEFRQDKLHIGLNNWTGRVITPFVGARMVVGQISAWRTSLG